MSHEITSLQGLEAAIKSQLGSGNADGSSLASERQDLMERYLALPYAEDSTDPGRSKFISTDVADVVDATVPQLMEIFASSDDVAKFTPVGKEDEQAAEQETEAVKHVFWAQNDGFALIQTWIKDGLIQKVGYCKAWWESSLRPQMVKQYKDQTAEQVAMLAQDLGVDLMAALQGAPLPPTVQLVSASQGQAPDGTPMFTLAVRQMRQVDMVRCEPVPPEEVIVSSQWSKVTLDGCPFVAHRKAQTRSRLIEMGFDRDQVKLLGMGGGANTSIRFTAKTNEQAPVPADPSMEEVDFAECWIWFDYNGDGMAELRKVYVAGPSLEVLIWAAKDGEPARPALDEVPRCGIVAWTPDPQPHRHIGCSLAEKATQIQRAQTVLGRQSLNNIYATNDPRIEVAQDGIIPGQTIEDIQARKQFIRTARIGTLREIPVPQILGNTLPMMDMLSARLEKRTGVTPYNQGLDSESLNKTLGGMQMLRTASQQKTLLQARNFAAGMRELFLLIHDLHVAHGSRKLTMRIKNQWVDVDPSEWSRRSDITIEVGLGSGNRAESVGVANMILEKQAVLKQAGSPLVDDGRIFNGLAAMVKAGGLKDPGQFFVPPEEAQPKPEAGPSVQEQLAVEAVEIEKAKVLISATEAKAKLDLEWFKARSADDRERDNNEGRLYIDLLKVAGDAHSKAQAELDAIINRYRPQDGEKEPEAPMLPSGGMNGAGMPA